LEEKRQCIEEWGAYCCSVELAPGEVVARHKKQARVARTAAKCAPLVQEMIRMMQAGEAPTPKRAAMKLALQVDPFNERPLTADTNARLLVDLYAKATGYIKRKTGRAPKGARRTPGTMSLIEASGALGIPRQTLYMMIIDGKLPATRTDYGLWEIPNEELERIMQKLGPLQPRGWAEQYVLDVLDQSPVALKEPLNKGRLGCTWVAS